MKFSVLFLLFFSTLAAQTGGNGSQSTPNGSGVEETQPPAPDKIEIKPTARDHEIQARLQAILDATGWFFSPTVQVKEGVVFLHGKTETEEFKKWAGNLARNTQDVAAVVNKIDLIQPSIWDFEPTLIGLREFWQVLIKVLPKLIFGLLILVITWFAGKYTVKASKKLLSHRITSALLQDVLAKGFGVCIILFGLFVIFKILGLTTIALTILGGTGVLGIVIGIAFRDITENLLASIFLSIQHPFRSGDLIEIEGLQGYVERLTIRSTILLSLDGTHVQIPNATVYKTTIRNYTINPNRQDLISLEIGDQEEIPRAQEVALKVLEEHPAVLKDPEPLVLVDRLGKATVQLAVYYWINGKEYSWLKVRSSMIRLIKRAFQHEGIFLPRDVYEILLPEGLNVKLTEKERVEKEQPTSIPKEAIVTSSEADLKSEFNDLQEQAKQARPLGKGDENLLSHPNEEG